MSRWLREFRLIPVVIIAAGCLFVLKSMGIILDGGYTLGQRLGSDSNLVVTRVPASRTVQLQSPSVPLAVSSRQQDGSKQSWMQEMFSYPDVTGSVAAKPAAKDAADKDKEAAKDGKQGPPAAAQPPEPKPVDGKFIPVNQPRISGAERAVLERLQERRQELDARARELDMRESLLKAAERKSDDQGGTGQKLNNGKAATPQAKEDSDAARMKSVVVMYETMKPKDAAKIFDRLDIKVLMEMATRINPRQMSEILAQMSPEAAERLTVELATRTGEEKAMNPANLPKIEGKRTN